MDKQEFVDYDNLKFYDEQLKEYIDNKIVAAISEYRTEDQENEPSAEIEEF